MARAVKKNFTTYLRKCAAFLGRHKILSALAVLLFLFLSPVSLYRQRASYCCSGCLSGQDVYQWFFGDWSSWSVPLSPKHVKVRNSYTFVNFTPSNHVHTWVHAQTSPYYLGFRWGGCALGLGGYHSDFADWYEKDRDFRDFIAAKESRKELDRGQVLRMLLLPNRIHGDPLKDPQSQQDLFISKKLIDGFMDGQSN